MNVLGKESFAYLVKQHHEVQFQWAVSGPQEVTLTFYTRGKHGEELVMPLLEARAYWHTMITKLGYVKGVKCSTQFTK